MPYCAILGCKNDSRTNNLLNGGISYHRFPKEPLLKERWLEATGRKVWFPTKESTVCSAHFSQDVMGKKKSGKRFLSQGATPTNDIWSRNQLNVSPYTPAIAGTSVSMINNDNAERDIHRTEVNIPTSAASTPRKRKLQDIITRRDSQIKRQRLQIKKLQAQNRRYRKKIKKMDDVLKALEDKFWMRDEDLSVLKNTNLQVHELTDRFIDADRSGGSIKNKYSPALRSFALTLHYYSPKAYQYVRSTFNTCLPHIRTLKKWYETIEGEPGFTQESFAALKLKAGTTNYPIIAGLSLDEMAIRRRIEWDGKKLHGYVDIGSGVEGDHLAEAKEALVFLVTGINCKWKVPVGYFLVDGVTGRQRADLVQQCLELINDTGIKIISLTFDGCSANLAMLQHLHCSIENRNITFRHPITRHQVVAMLDPPHMVKLLRNAFQCYKVIVDPHGNKIKWAFLEELNRVQEKEKFHLANKLRYHHIYFHNQKMKVKLATQLFSLSVADAIDFCREDLKLTSFQGSEATSKFLRVVNNMFDIFNSRSMYHQGYKKALNENNATQVHEYLEMAVSYMSGLKCENGTLVIKSPRKTGFIGFIGCADAVKHVYTHFIQTEVLIYMPMYKMSQDHLELLFGNIRAHGGANNNPTARQFKAAYKKLLVHIEIKDAGYGNCTALEQLSILNCSSAIERINRTTNRVLDHNDDQSHNGFDNEEIDLFFQNMSEFSLQIIGYISGYIAHVLMKKICCDICIGALLSNENNTHHKFVVAKDKGGLLYPSKDLIQICKKSEAVIRFHTDNLLKVNKHKLTTNILRNFIGTKLFIDISYHQIGEFPTANHITDLTKAIIEKYIDVRLHFLLKNLNLRDTKRQLLNKYVLFQGQ